MPLSQQQARYLAELVATIRPEWQVAGLMASLAKCRNERPVNVALALLRMADDAGVRNPGALPNPDGPHWSERKGDPMPHQPARKEHECRAHPGEHADRCRACASDRLAGTTTKPRRDTAGVDVSKHVATLRAQVRGAESEESK